mmetsp:Transcript_13178/g.25850  ORF Transcript_13178/g.25850 Transcript_13178/m.25850 type:complete len:104 (-) Transcript_13178:838-1149(-)
MAPSAAIAAAVALIVALAVTAVAGKSRASIQQVTEDNQQQTPTLPSMPPSQQHPLLFFPTFSFFFFFAFDSPEVADGPSGRTMTWSKACDSPETWSMPLKPCG